MFCVDENTRLVIDLDARAADCDTLAFSIVGGADGAAFQIDARIGLLTFRAAPDYEAPTDADGNNVYKVIVAVSDGEGGSRPPNTSAGSGLQSQIDSSSIRSTRCRD